MQLRGVEELSCYLNNIHNPLVNLVYENVCIITILPTKRISALSQWKTFMRVLPTHWHRYYVTVTQCMAYSKQSQLFHKPAAHVTLSADRMIFTPWVHTPAVFMTPSELSIYCGRQLDGCSSKFRYIGSNRSPCKQRVTKLLITPVA